ncbi:FAD-dependent oxidoreductase [Rariglobus hedericola]|uniref:FAD-dependent oxidoreductase n=1 Tax=Rariglobus hedericola TaxID=2597822 RepID=A0A556QSM8_9BACT|nr:FAD-dependent oxidoreductase [Rariglobus hedericola]TSJ79644.1 FAD-dependent oxidoreductase [Rariglobus hedericola]
MSSTPVLGFYEEPARTLPVIAECDVLVVGGGPGGIGAAVSAARNGANTILVERFGSFGGTWTAGILSAIMPYPYVKGIFAEVVRAWQERGGWNEGHWGAHDGWGGGGTYDSEVAKVALDRLVVDSGVTPLFFAQAAAVIREGNRVRGVIIESKEGRQVILAKMVIDSSGDGDVSVMAGVPADKGRESDGGVQPMTMIFKMTGVDDERAVASKQADPDFAKAWQAAKARGEITVPREDVLAGRNPKPGEWNFNTTRIVGKDATKLRDVTDAMVEARRQVAEVAAFMRKNIPGFENAVVSETAPHIGVRESRRIRGDYTVSTKDIVEVTPFEDCIACGNWFIDIHSPTGEGTERVYPPEGKWYGVPYRTIRAQGVDNLLIASRCVDSSHEAHAAIRITPQVMAIGEGAGAAAALCVKLGLKSTRDLDAKLLRETLRKQGAFV